MKIIAQESDWVAFWKPAGFHVHPPEDARFPVPRHLVMLYQARDQVGQHVYPIHRLDVATCGVLLMALSKDSASFLAKQFQERSVQKTYHAVVRGWTPDEQRIDQPLSQNEQGEDVLSVTSYKRLARVEIPEVVGLKFPTARYSFLEVKPETGRYHQIRRHMNRVAHPIVGDVAHGDSHHNRYFRERWKIPGLCLKAHALKFQTPAGETRELIADDDQKWSDIHALFNGEFRS